MKQQTNKTTKLIVIMVSIAIVLCAIFEMVYSCPVFSQEPTDVNHYRCYSVPYVQRSTMREIDINFHDARTRLAIEVDKYIKKVAPKSKVDALILIDLCALYNVDLRLALVQGHVESHFGTQGTARKTNSVFNVGAYDGHSANRQKRNGFGFEDPNDSIEPYLKLLVDDYLVKGRTEEDLLKNFVNKHGMRYASATQYESALRQRWKSIDKYANITDTYNEFLAYKGLL